MLLTSFGNFHNVFDQVRNVISSKVTGQSQASSSPGAVSSIQISAKPPPLFALIIGINEYTSDEFENLEGAVADGQAVKSYLETALGVPTSQIETLFNEKATRKAIIESLRGLKQDPRIKPGDPILMYYAGHGSTADAPAGWETGGTEIQLLISYDALSRPEGKTVIGIPDRTIGALLEKIAQEKGDNITVIFDCCHSGSGTRGAPSHGPDPTRIRGVKMTLDIPPELDKDIWGGRRGMAIPARFQRSGLRSHVLLSACSSEESAREARGRGYFTKNLLDTLERVGADRVTYVDLVQRIPCLLLQNPQCEGVNQGRICFNSMAPVRTSLLYPVRQLNQKYVIDAGTIHGITDGAIFGLYNDRSLVATQPPVATLKASNPGAFSTNLNPITEGAEFTFDEPAFALFIRAGREEDLRISVVPDTKLMGIVQEVASEMEADGSAKSKFMLVKKEMAELEIAVDKNRIVFNILDPFVTIHGLTRIPFSVSPTPGAMAPVIGKAATYFRHLRRTGVAKAILDNIIIEFTRLSEAKEEYDDDLNRIRKPCGENLINSGVIDIVVEGDAIYGIKITNKWNKPLYPSLFFFDNSDLGITSYFQPPTSSGDVDPPLRPEGNLTIGYGSGGGAPFEYTLRDGQDIDIGFLKFFISTDPVDLSDLEQVSPFEGVRGMRSKRGNAVGAWSTVLITVVQRRKPST